MSITTPPSATLTPPLAQGRLAFYAGSLVERPNLKKSPLCKGGCFCICKNRGIVLLYTTPPAAEPPPPLTQGRLKVS